MIQKAWYSNMRCMCPHVGHIFTEGAQDWEEVLYRRVNPNMTKFKAMTMDEKFETIEHTAQEAIRVREENQVVEVNKA